MRKKFNITLAVFALFGTSQAQDNVQQVLDLLNEVRVTPKVFLEARLLPFIKEKNLNRNRFARSLVKELKSKSSVGPLQLSEALTLTAKAHAIDIGEKNKVGHTSSNGTTFDKRLRIPANAKGAIAENCDYGNEQPLDIVMSLLIDDGIESLGHRKNILDARLVWVGLAIEKHKKYRVNCVMDFAEKF